MPGEKDKTWPSIQDDAERIQQMREPFQEALLTWYKEQQRELPWRKNSDPYRVWVSEVMLQQTRVETVKPYYERFMERFPSLQALALAEEEEVLKYWEGLGYYSRARNLLKGVREVSEHYGGTVPSDHFALSSISGIGSYTSGAILSIAYNQSIPAVDGNVMRVMSRLLSIGEDIAKESTKKRVREWVALLIPDGEASSFNQALMEVGALICTPRNPRCKDCPLRMFCSACVEDKVNQFPVKRKKKPLKRVPLAVVIPWNPDCGAFLIRRRPSKGLLAGLWEFPSIAYDVGTDGDCEKGDLASSLAHWLTMEYGGRCDRLQYSREIRHTFTHLRWEAQVYFASLHTEANLDEVSDRTGMKHRWVKASELSRFTFPAVFASILRQIEQESG